MVPVMGPLDYGARPIRSATCCVRSTIALALRVLFSTRSRNSCPCRPSKAPRWDTAGPFAGPFILLPTAYTRITTPNADTHDQVTLRIGFTENLLREQNQVVLEADRHGPAGAGWTKARDEESLSDWGGVNDDLWMIGELSQVCFARLTGGLEAAPPSLTVDRQGKQTRHSWGVEEGQPSELPTSFSFFSRFLSRTLRFPLFFPDFNPNIFTNQDLSLCSETKQPKCSPCECSLQPRNPQPLSVLMAALLLAALTLIALSEDVDVAESLVSVDEVELLGTNERDEPASHDSDSDVSSITFLRLWEKYKDSAYRKGFVLWALKAGKCCNLGRVELRTV